MEERGIKFGNSSSIQVPDDHISRAYEYGLRFGSHINGNFVFTGPEIAIESFRTEIQFHQCVEGMKKNLETMQQLMQTFFNANAERVAKIQSH